MDKIYGTEGTNLTVDLTKQPPHKVEIIGQAEDLTQ